MPIELNESGYMGSISYVGQKVKLQGVPFAELATKPQAGVKHPKQNNIHFLDKKEHFLNQNRDKIL